MPYIENTSQDIKTPLARARGAGSAKGGTHHWWMQRLTAVALVPLTIWMLSCLKCLVSGNQAELVLWLQSPFAAIVMGLFIITSFYHASLGIQTVIEDYVHDKGMKTLFIILCQFGLFAAGFIALFALMKINFGIVL